jgi:hypothetical protein
MLQAGGAGSSAPDGVGAHRIVESQVTNSNNDLMGQIRRGREGEERSDDLPTSSPAAHSWVMELLNFLIILWAGWLVWRRPERERLAFGLMLASFILMAFLFLVGTRGSLVPGVNL